MNIEDLNTSEGLSSPKSYRMADLCKYCHQSRQGDSLLTPKNSHPLHIHILKCKLHNCWVSEDGICDDYKMHTLY